MPGFQVDLPQLEEGVAAMAEFDGQVEQWLAEVDRHIADLHLTWTGSAADAQREYHERWMRGVQQMRDALAKFRADAQRAHRNYTGAANTNHGMWA